MLGSTLNSLSPPHPARAGTGGRSGTCMVACHGPNNGFSVLGFDHDTDGLQGDVGPLEMPPWGGEGDSGEANDLAGATGAAG